MIINLTFNSFIEGNCTFVSLLYNIYLPCCTAEKAFKKAPDSLHLLKQKFKC